MLVWERVHHCWYGDSCEMSGAAVGSPLGRLDVVTLDDPDDSSCMTFVLREEDHTLGNALRYMIMKNPDVTFCGYSVPHPSESKINLRIQTNGIPAVEALRKGLEDLHGLCSHALQTIKVSVDHFKQTQTTDEDAMT